MKISKNFTLEEFTESDLAKRLNIDNKFEKEEYKDNIIKLVTYVLQPLRNELKEPIHINSGYRCKELNKEVRGRYNSQHMQGMAADIVTSNLENTMESLMNGNYKFDQLIRYRNFIHVSYNERKNRNQVIYKNI